MCKILDKIFFPDPSNNPDIQKFPCQTFKIQDWGYYEVYDGIIESSSSDQTIVNG